MKVVLTFDMGAAYVEELRTAFPELDFCPAYSEAEQVPEVVNAEVVFGLMKRPVFLAAKELKWLVVTAPRTEATTGMFNQQRLALLKEGAFVVVVSRGGIVDEEALAEGLHAGRIGGAALDATEIEPLPPDSPLWDAPNMLISPHASAESVQLIERRKAIFVENLRRYLAGAALLNVCDLEKGY